MLGYRSCPRCKGKMYADNDFHGWYVQCLICGYTYDLNELDLSQDKTVEVEHKTNQNGFCDLRLGFRSKYG